MMPTIITEQEIKIEVDFEVYCNTCGCGLCNETTVKGHQSPQLKVNACPDCMKEKQEEIDDLNDDIRKLNAKIESLLDELSNLNTIIKEQEEK